MRYKQLRCFSHFIFKFRGSYVWLMVFYSKSLFALYISSSVISALFKRLYTAGTAYYDLFHKQVEAYQQA